MLSDEERERFVNALAVYLNPFSNPRAEIVALGGAPDVTLDLKYAETPRGYATQLVELVVNDAWNRTPPLLVRVLSRFPEWGWAEQIIVRVRTPPASWQSLSDPLQALWLDSSRLPFLNRLALRGHLGSLAAPDEGPSVLLVNGGRKSGKSYTIELLRHWRERRRADAAASPGPTARGLEVALVTHGSGEGASLTEEALVRRIADAMQLNATELPTGSATPNRTSHYLVDWVLQQAETSGNEWWVVIDGLSDPDVPELTRNLVTNLAQNLSAVTPKRATRLILIDYPPGALPGVPAQAQAMEQIGPIGELDVKAFLGSVLSKNGAVPEPYINSLVQVATTLVPNGDLACLNQVLTKVATMQGAE